MSESEVSRAAPAELPLPGGREGATLTLRPLLCARMKGPPGWFERTEGPTAGLKALGIGVPRSEMIDVPVVAFLLEHPGAGLVLVDTGFHSSIAARSSRERARNLGTVGRLLARTVEMRPEQAVAAQLEALGIGAADIGLVVMTHLHFDHASALCDFPRAMVVLARREWEAAHARAPFMHGYVAAQLDPRPSYCTIEFPATPAPPAAQAPLPVPTVDLFGDGSLVLASTPGHTLGHLSLIVRLARGEALIAGDAIYTLATLRDGARPWRAEDRVAFEHSVQALAEWDRAHPGAVVIPGHDMQAWEGLAGLYA